MRKTVIAAMLCSSSLAYANDTIISGTPMDVLQSAQNLEALGREVAGINPALTTSFELGSINLEWVGPDGNSLDGIALDGLIGAGVGANALVGSSSSR